MKKKLLGIFVCMLLMTAAVVSAVEIMNIATPIKVDKNIKTDTIEKESNEKSLSIEEQEDINPPQPLATKTGYLSIPAAAFIPNENGKDYYNWGYKVRGPSGGGFTEFVAPVYLPHEANVTKLTFYWQDTDGQLDIFVWLYRYSADSGELGMGGVYSNGSSGYGSSSTSNIFHADIDNSLYTYYLFTWATNSILYSYVIIEYTYDVNVISGDLVNSQQNQVTQEILSR